MIGRAPRGISTSPPLISSHLDTANVTDSIANEFINSNDRKITVPSRRALLSALGTTPAALTAGCLASRPGDETETATPADLDPRAYPDKPDPLTEDDVVSFVREYEEAATYNEYLSEDTISLSVSCPTALDLQTDRGYFLVSVCQGGMTDVGRSDTVSTGEFGSEPAYYFVSPDRTDRIANRVWDDGDTYGDGTTSSEVQGFRIVNFRTVAIDLTLSLHHRQDDGMELVLEDTVKIPPESIYSRSAVTAKRGTYEFTVGQADDAAHFEWEITDINPPFGATVVLTDTGNLLFGTSIPSPGGYRALSAMRG